jgi:hypothetical protein
MGHLDAVDVRGRRVTLYGWAADPNAPGGSLPVLAAASGHFAWGIAGGSRPDVAAPGLSGSSGYAVAMDLPPGRHSVCIAGMDVQDGVATGQFTRFGCQDVVIVK